MLHSFGMYFDGSTDQPQGGTDQCSDEAAFSANGALDTEDLLVVPELVKVHKTRTYSESA